jgi:hypothetical protein
MADVWGRSNQDFGGAFPVDGARIAVAGNNGNLLGVGLLTQNLGFNYNQPITFLFEIGTNLGYAIAGRARGNVNISRILGPRPMMKDFYVKYGNVCNMATNIMNVEAKSAACLEGASTDQFTLGMHYLVINALGGSVASENSLFTETLGLQYLTLDLN